MVRGKKIQYRGQILQALSDFLLEKKLGELHKETTVKVKQNFESITQIGEQKRGKYLQQLEATLKMRLDFFRNLNNIHRVSYINIGIRE